MKNLTQPRYLVIADYPNSPFNVGNILTQHTQFNKDAYFVNGNLYTDRHPEDYPHLFRLLHWWEFRDEKEMGGYFIGKWRGDAYYIKVDNWVKEGTIFNAKVGDINFVADYCTPITESQYNEYIKTK